MFQTGKTTLKLLLIIALIGNFAFNSANANNNARAFYDSLKKHTKTKTVKAKTGTRFGNVYAKNFTQKRLNKYIKQGKKVLVYMHWDKCGYCRKFERSTLKNSRVVKAINKPNVRFLAAERSNPKAQSFIRRKVKGYPTVYIYSPKYPKGRPINWGNANAIVSLLN